MHHLLLISSSRTDKTGFLEHCGPAIQERLAAAQRVLFVPYALYDHHAYAAKAREAFASLGYQLDSLHEASDPISAIWAAEAIFVGGGNTFRLLKALHDANLVTPIQRRVHEGMPYLGSSAGTVIACPSLRTTNDMPIVQPPTFDALDLIPFQINPHYLDADPASTHQGETRETRLKEFLEENDVQVLGIREGSWLWVDERRCRLGGATGGVLFERERPPREIPGGSELMIGASRLCLD